MTAVSTGQRMPRSQAPYDILLIEDDEAIGEMLTECIESESSFRVRSLSSGEEVIQHLQEIWEASPFLFIIDYLLPGMNGLQLFDHLQSLESFEQVSAIMITATTMAEDMQTALRDRSLALLTKPFELSELLGYLEYIHNNSRQQLLKIYIQHATLARLRGQESKALSERISAAYFCQQILDSLVQPVLLRILVQEILASPPVHSMPDSPSLPHLPELHLEFTAFNPRFEGLVEIYCSAGEAAEELSRTAVSSNYKHDCFSQANHCFNTAITLAQTIVSAHERDPGYLIRTYQRYASLLEERLAASPEDREETSSILATLLREGFTQIKVTNK